MHTLQYGHECECNEGTLPVWPEPIGTGNADAAMVGLMRYSDGQGGCMWEGAYRRAQTWRRRGREGKDIDMEAMAMVAWQGEGTTRWQWAERRCSKWRQQHSGAK